MTNAPAWWTGPPDRWGATAAQATGMSTYVNGRHVVVPVPEEYRRLVIPWQYVDKPLPVGAYKSLWPNARGNAWVKAKPTGFGVGWLPTGPARWKGD